MKTFIFLCTILLPWIANGQNEYKTYYNDKSSSVKIENYNQLNIIDSSKVLSRFADSTVANPKSDLLFSDSIFVYNIDSTTYRIFRYTECCCQNIGAPTGHSHNCNTIYYNTQFGIILSYDWFGDLSFLTISNGKPIHEKLIRRILEESGILDINKNKKLKKDYKKKCLTKPKLH